MSDESENTTTDPGRATTRDSANRHSRKANAASGAYTPEQKAQKEAADTVPPKRKVSMELHPQTFVHRVKLNQDDSGDNALQSAKHAFTSLSKTLDDLYAREVTIRADRSKTTEHHKLRVSKLATNALSTPSARMDGARATVTQSVEAIDNNIDRYFKEALTADEAREIRAHIKTLSPEDRRAFLSNDADDQVVAAVLAAKPFLSGLTTGEAAAVRHYAVQRNFPAELERRAKLVAARDMLDASWERYMVAVTQLRDSRADEYEAAATAADTAATEPIKGEEEEEA